MYIMNCVLLTQEAVQRLFKDPAQDKDDFTMWCEASLEGMDAQIDSECSSLHSVFTAEYPFP